MRPRSAAARTSSPAALPAQAQGPSTATAGQSLDVWGAAAEIDAGSVAAKVSAYVGGYAGQEDTVRLDASFLSAAGTTLGAIDIGPVTSADRQRVTTLLERAAQAVVPKGTRAIAALITMSSGDSASKVHAFADNVSVELVAAATPPVTVAKPTFAATCARRTLVLTVRPAVGAAVRAVTFVVNGKKIATDRTAPFVARVPTRGLAAQLRAVARVTLADKTVVLTKAIRRC